jgi:hypothetical protein
VANRQNEFSTGLAAVPLVEIGGMAARPVLTQFCFNIPSIWFRRHSTDIVVSRLAD